MFVYFYKLLSNCFYSNNNFISKGQIDHVEINGRKNYCNSSMYVYDMEPLSSSSSRTLLHRG